MNTLYQKFHGIPGIGVISDLGKKGISGNKIKIGFINNFFDGLDVSLSTLVKMAKRKVTHDASYSQYIVDLINTANNKIEEHKKINNNDLYYRANIFKDTSITDFSNFFIDGSSNMYYTGHVTDNNGINSDLFTQDYTDLLYDIDKTDIASNFWNYGDNGIVTSDMAKDLLVNLPVDNYEFHLIYTINKNTSTYIDLYDYMEAENILSNLPLYDVSISVNTVSYEPEDIAYIMKKSNNYINYDNNGVLDTTDSSFFTYHKIDPVSGIIEEDILTDEQHNLCYYKDPSIWHYDVSLYQEGVHTLYADISNNTIKIKNYPSANYLLEYTNGNPLYYIHVTESIFPGLEFGDAYLDDYGQTLVGFDLYKNADIISNNSLNIDYLLESLKPSGNFTNFKEQYAGLIYDYVNRYNISIKNLGKEHNNYIRWDSEDFKTIKLPTTLRSDINVGDILYFYTDENKFAKDHIIEYMVVVTENLLNCDTATLISHAKLSKPFLFLNIFTNKTNSRVVLYNKTNLLKKADNETGIESYYSRSLTNIVAKNSLSCLYIHSNNNLFINLITNTDLRDTHINSLTCEIIKDDLLEEAIYLNSNHIIKSSELYVNKEQYLSNIELNSVICPNELYLTNGFILHIVTNDISEKINLGNIKELIIKFISYTITQDKLNYVSENMADNYNMGMILIVNEVIENSGKYETQKYIGTYDFNTAEQLLIIDIDPLNDLELLHYDNLDENKEDIASKLILYELINYVCKNNGFKYFSQPRTYIFDCARKNNISLISKWWCVDDDNTNINTQNDNTYITIDFEGLKCSKVSSNCVINISDDIILDNIYFNTNEYKANSDISFKNDWFTANSIKGSEKNKITLEITVTDNIPNYTLKANTTEETNIESEYMISLNDTDSEEFKSNQVYNLIFNKEIDNEVILCDLFYKLVLNYILPSTKNRALNLFFKYHREDAPLDFLYESFVINLPGFVDPRTLPIIDIKLYNDIKNVELINAASNGVLTNLFRTFMSVDIKDFNYDTWGRYISENDDVLIDIEIKNISKDLEWLKENGLNNGAYKRSTVKIMPDSEDIITSDNFNDNLSYANYHLFEIKGFTSKQISLNLQKITENNLSNIEDNSKIVINIDSYLMDTPIGTKAVPLEYDNHKYIILDNKTVNGLKNPDNIYSGIFHDITIKLENLTLEDVKNTFYFRILSEFGNPVLANIYLRFAVTKIVIKYKKEDGNYVTFTSNGGENVDIDTYLKKNVDYYDVYTFITEPLKANINPISYIVCPNECDEHLIPLHGTVKKEASIDNILLRTSFYCSNLYDSDIINNISLEKTKFELKLSWKGLLLKKLHFLDNIKNIEITSNAIEDIYNNINSNNALYNSFLIDETKYTFKNIIETCIKNKVLYNSYLAVSYHSNILSPKLRDNVETFYLNDLLYLKSKYDLLNLLLPAFINLKLSWEIRTEDIMNAIDVWNFEYQQSMDKINTKLFEGEINSYGNSYMYLSADKDTNLYFNEGILPLSEVLEYNNETLYNKIEYFNISAATNISIYTPNKELYFRVPLYDINWEYTFIEEADEHTVNYCKMASPFDCLMEHLINNNNPYNEISLLRRRNILSNKYNGLVPYNLFYNIYPRVACNTDLNILMLRNPVIGYDNDNMEDTRNQRLNKHLYDLSNIDLEWNSTYTI